MNKKIVVVGGGTSGWLTASYIKKLYKEDAEITLVESEEIGIIGAGEGSVPSFVGFLIEHLNINPLHFLNYVNGTHKIGVHFDNWCNDGKTYLHDFFSTDIKANPMAQHSYMGFVFDKRMNYNEAMFSKKMAYDNMSPMGKDSVREIVHHSFHFDAHLAAKFLRNHAESLGVVRVEGKVISLDSKSNGNIEKINLDNGKSLECDFVFDCSGFHRLIIGKHFNSKWISYKDKLTVNTAIPFQLEQSKTEIKPYTIAKAMEYGWLWQIPLQNRWGCGYIFDDNFISESDAKLEVEKTIGQNIQFGKTIKFEAGRYHQVWIKNCIAVGLSGGFVEPLEATSIGMQCLALKALRRIDLDYLDAGTINLYNLINGSINDDIADFLQFHYFSGRKDTEFWKYYNGSQIPISDTLKNRCESLKNDLKVKLRHSIFAPESYSMVGLGIKYVGPSDFIKKYKEEKKKNPNIDAMFMGYEKRKSELRKQMISEIDYLNGLKL